MAEDEKEPITKGWCDRVRHACATQVKERYEAMKELFLSKLDGVSDQLETTLTDLQKSLSLGSKRMAEIEEQFRKGDLELDNKIALVHQRVDRVLKDTSDAMATHEVAADLKFEKIDKDIKELGKTPWQLIALVITVLLAVGGAMMATWRQVGVHDERFDNLKVQMQELKVAKDKDIEDLQKHIREDDARFNNRGK